MRAKTFGLFRFLVIAFLFFSFPALATGQLFLDAGQEFDLVPNVPDARSAALGRTSILNAQPTLSMMINPALIGTMQNKGLGFSLATTMGELRNDSLNENYSSYDYKMKPFFSFQSVGYITPLKGNNEDFKFTFGISIGRFLDFSGRKLYKIRLDSLKNEFHTEYRGAIFSLNPTIAVKYKQVYYLGLTVNVGVYSKPEILIVNESSIINSDSLTKYELEQKSNVSATSICVGGVVKPTKELEFGFYYRPGFILSYEDIEYSWKQEILPLNTITEGEGNYPDYEIDIPSYYGVGINGRFIENILASAEYQARGYRDIKIDGKDLNVNNGRCIRLGLEYLSPTPLRIGYYADSIIYTKLGDEEPIIKKGITLGISVNMQESDIDVAIDIGNVRWYDNIVDNMTGEINRIDSKVRFYRLNASVLFNF